ncbi:MAG TPA: SusC/RagA family TonB-linked outer membrane protein, partial [Prolixibacteraceae bacterium]|nr:SusC/RagA family TonB-linked outer membrane protein [Prolixibacteraceae bacterium]
ADPITYMRLHNEAVRTRDPLNPLPYSPEKIEQTILGANPYAYPMTDWYSSLMKDYTFNHRLNFNISGGGKIARYYLSGSVTQDNGNLKVDQKNDFNSNIDLKKYLIRSNVELDLTPTTVAMVRVHGTFDDYRGPIYGGTDMYRNIMRSNPVLFPAYFQPDKANEYTNHILFGNFGNANYINPYAEMVKGYKDRSYSLMLAQIELKQDLNFITEGLSARVLGNTTRVAEFAVRRNYNPYYYEIDSFDRKTGQYVLKPLNAETGTEYLNYSEDPKTVTSTFYNENILQYDRTFDDKHAVSGLLVGIVRQFLSGNAGNLQASLPQRNLGLSGRFTYAYDNRYFTEFDFGYNGTERFAAQERFGFFPAFSVGYIISNEAFWEPWKKTISKLKFKGSYGLVGNDQIGDVNDRFFYLSNVNLNDGGRGYTWGTDGDYYRPGVSISRYANDKITWETAVKSNVGFELGLFNEIEIIAEYFREYRRNILMDRLSMATFGLQAPTRANLGEASSQGVDASVDIQHNFTKEWWLTSRINFTYARGVFEKFEEPDFSETPWRSRIGYPITQQWGYIAERLFVDDQEVRNSPVQDFGSIVRGGDIKYHDINGDDKINELDLVPIGYPTTPEINYGFGASTGFKGVDFSFFFQGSARSSFWIDTWATSPFYNYHYNGEDSNLASKYANNALLKAYANSHWSETNRDVYALWPRLSETIEANNVQRNTWFMQDGGFLRLKSAEVGYTLPASFTKPMKVASARIYLSGTNLMVWSKFKLWDPEMAGNGLNYPVQRVFNAGINIDF